jgi:hypothetical protein
MREFFRGNPAQYRILIIALEEDAVTRGMDPVSLKREQGE